MHRTLRVSFPLTLSLSLALLTGCQPPQPPVPGTPVTSLSDSGPGSLRAAIDAAKAGDTLRLTQTGTLTLQSPLSTAKNLTILATGVTVQAPTGDRALEVPAGVTVTLRGGTLQGSPGGLVPAGLTRPALSSAGLNRAALSKAVLGAQFMRLGLDTPKLSAAGLQAQAEEAPTPTTGGVLLNEGTLTLDGVTVTGGKANLGGGIHNAAGATLTLTGTTNVIGNEASLYDEALAMGQGYGGGIYSEGILTLTGGRVDGNEARWAGGGIYVSTRGSFTMSSGSVDDNKSTLPLTTNAGQTRGASAGGIFSLGNVTISGGSVSGNSTSYFGGGIAVQAYRNTQNELVAPNLTVSGGTFENNVVTDDAGGGSGGAMWVGGNLTMTGGTLRGNAAPYGGGLAVFRNGTITGGLIEGNRARTRNGGGILAYTASSEAYTLNLGGSVIIRGNTAQMNGGGLLADGIPVVMSSGTVENNTAVTGGGLYLSGRTRGSRLTGGTVANNNAERGGGLHLGGSSSGVSDLRIEGGSITGNTASITGGGLTLSGQVTMTGGSVSGNTVAPGEGSEGGGGVRLYAAAKFTASGGSIQNNRAPWGAGVLVDGAWQGSQPAEFTLAGATVSGNVVTDTSNVGGGFFNGGKLTITSGSVTGNTATRHGGGIFNVKSATYAQPGGTVSGNTPDNVFNEP